MSWIVPVLEWGRQKKVRLISAHDPKLAADDDWRKKLASGDVDERDPRLQLEGLTEFFFRPMGRQEYEGMQLDMLTETDPTIAGSKMGLAAFCACCLAVVVGDERIDGQSVIVNSVPLEVKVELGNRLLKLCTRLPDPLSGR